MAKEDELSSAKPLGLISEFRCNQSILEARHPFSLLHWDKSGAIWSEFSRKWPELESAKIDPAHTQFILNNRYSIFTSIDKSGVIDLQPSKSGENAYAEIIKDFFQIVIKYLEVSSFTRLGHRQQYFKQYKNQDQASASFFATNLINVPSSSNFGIEELPVLPEVAMRWENKKIGTTLRMKVEGIHHILDAPGSQVFTRQEIEETGIVIDVDYYTKVAISVGQLNIPIWLNQADQIIKRGVNKILGGK